MGYRSQVKMLFTFPDELRRDAFIARAETICEGYETKDNDGIFDWPKKTKRGECEWLVEFNDVKWYTGTNDYSHVNAWEKVKHETWDECNCEFIRVGEESGDIEHAMLGNGEADHNMYAQTEIVVD